MSWPTHLSPDTLFNQIGTAESPILVDVRIDEHFAADPRLIPTAKRLSHHALSDAAAARPFADRRVAVICQRGQKLSQGAAAWLRQHGTEAGSLSGGFEVWRDAGLPLVDTTYMPAQDVDGRTVWVTRERPKVDRIACPWLIRRFIDPDAAFLFVEASEVAMVADRFGATPFDIEGVFWTHRGDTCTFDTMLDEFGLRTPALDRLSAIVRGADTARPDLAPQAAGLLAASLGLSRAYDDDLKQLDAGMILYDALYLWCRDAVHETHTWTGAASSNVAVPA